MKKKHVIVTGGSRGIGRGIVENLANRGYQVSFLYKSNHDAAEAVMAKLSGNEVIGYQCDVCDFQQTKAVIDQIIAESDGVDGIVNNSGITKDKVLMMMQEEDWQSVINTNLNGCFHVTKAINNHFLKKRSGKVVNISSVAGIQGIYGQTNYCAAKSGIIGFTKSLAREVAKYGIMVNAVAPGYIDTDMTKAIPEKVKKELLSQIPMGEMGNIDDVAQVVAFLLSDAARYITGQIIAVDGGITA